jgi:hypothetical protein
LASQVENIITGVEALKGADPGKALNDALQPVIKKRKTQGTWEVDNWELKDEIPKPEDDSPDEALIIVFDLSSSMNRPLGNNWNGNLTQNDLSRLDETKQVFRNLIARMIGYNLGSTYVGLVPFNTDVKEVSDLSRLRSDFRTKLENARPVGYTSLWDALMKAHDMLRAFKIDHPKTKLRVIALTDGIDNKSSATPEAVCRLMFNASIVVDSLVIGTAETKNLFKISKHTGGYAFNPTSRLLLFQTLLLEPFLDIHARPDIVRVPIVNWSTSTPKEAEMKTVYNFPPCRPHDLQVGAFISLDAASRFFTTKRSASLLGQAQTMSASSPGIGGTSRPLGADRLCISSGKIFLDEMRHMIGHPHASMDVYVNEVNMSFWKIVMQGPANSPYEHGTFVLFVHMTASYPQTAPIVRFITPILHPNITKVRQHCFNIQFRSLISCSMEEFAIRF